MHESFPANMVLCVVRVTCGFGVQGNSSAVEADKPLVTHYLSRGRTLHHTFTLAL